ncbi:MAG: biotin-dependent carboxyltransferase family protein [Bryobacteraceae bacterium]|jgi:antagonist of KipI
MNQVRVIAPGLESSIQDLGRFGWAHFGVSAAGAADALALRAGNLLVGNAENAAGLEMTLMGVELEFESAAVIALTGSDFGSGLPLWTPIEVPAGDRVRCAATRGGARCYLSVRGGIEAPKIMGSASAHLTTGVGGGRLRKGDVLAIGDAAIRRPRKAARGFPYWNPATTLRVTPGPQAEWFGEEIYRSAYTVSEESSRMGLRLRGQTLTGAGGHMISEGVSLGAVQAPPDGQPIILFVDHQTTGGYPKPANVISADFWRLGQMRPRDEIRFECVTIDQALRFLQEQEEWLYSL